MLPTPQLPFGVRFVIFLGIVGAAMTAAAVVFVLVGLLGARLTLFTPALALALIVGTGVLTAGLIIALWSNTIVLAARDILIALAGVAVVVVVLFVAGVMPLGPGLIVLAAAGLIALFLFALWFNVGVHRVPLELLGLGIL